MKNKRIYLLIFSLLLYVAAMTIFAFFDLDISLALYNKDSLFAKIFEAIAEIPFTFLGFSAFTILFLTREKEKKWINIFVLIISIIGMLAYGFLLPFFVLNYLKVHKAWIYGIALTIPDCVASYFLYKALCKKHASELKRIAIVAILTMLIEQLLINGIKFTWGRPRMRDLANPSVDFYPWYIPKWFSGSDSFPSGHSANAACVFVYTLVPAIFHKQKKIGYSISLLICSLWLLTVMISRIIAGAHFASDVLTGAAITLFAFHFVKSGLYKEKKEE